LKNPLINASPISNIASLRTVDEGAVVSLDGSASSDVDSPVLTYAWSFVTKPTESEAVFSDTTAEPTFIADKPGTYIVQLIVNDGNSDSSPITASVEVLETLLIARKTIADGYEPWITNGTAEGTRQLANINNRPNSSSPGRGLVVGGSLYFVADVAEREHGLYVSDGTPDNTQLLKNFGFDARVGSFMDFNGVLYFMVGKVLWKSNGTVDGTTMVKDMGGSFDAKVVSYVATDSMIYVLYYRGSSIYSIWKSDGSSAGTVDHLADFTYSANHPSGLTLSGNKIYFRLKNSDNGQELWALDIATDSVALFSDIKVGAGDSACEEALYLANLCTTVHMIVRRDEMRASKIMQERVFKTKNIKIYWNSNTEEVLGEKEVEGVRIVNNKTGEKTEIPIYGFFVAIGHKPNSDVFKDFIKTDDAGYVITEGKSSKTNVEGVFACGDLQDSTYRQAITAAGTGCMAALDAERFIGEQE